MPYYDSALQRVKYKSRPVLLLKAEKGIGESDFSILPISSISHKENIDEIFDIEITADIRNHLRITSFARTIPRTYKIISISCISIFITFFYLFDR